MLWVLDELSYDRFNKNADHIYRVVEDQYYAGGEVFPVAVTPGPLAKALKDEYPEIINSCRLTFITQSLRYNESTFAENILLVDSSFLKMFTFPLREGDINTALTQPFSILLSSKAAEKFFGKDDPIGKSLIVGSETALQVTGVFNNVPENSHLRFDYIIPFKILNQFGARTDNWGNNSYYTYVQLQSGFRSKDVDKKIIDIIKKNNEGSTTEIYLQPLVDIHLYSGSKYTADINGHGNIEYVNIFSLVAIFILLIACINFMNLATARSARRAKEVGLRKVVGAMRFQIIRQFFIESIILTFIALSFAVIIVNIFLPLFNELAGKTINFWDSSIAIYSGLLILVILTGIVSGSYPALYLSSFVPAKILKTGNTSDRKGSKFRKVLVILQFTLSIFLIICTTIIYNQLDYIQNKNLGFQRENIVFTSVTDKVKEKIESVKTELQKNPDILSASVSNSIPTYYGNSTSGIDWEGKNPDDIILMHYVSVDDSYINTFNMKLAKGRFYSKEFVSDTGAVVINETAAKIMGMNDPIGKRLTIFDSDLTIVGVVKDFHFKKLDTKIEPLVFLTMPQYNNFLFMRLSPNNISASLSFIDLKLKEFDPIQKFDFKFLDEQFDQLYRSEQRMGELFTSFSILAIFISCLGLFGLASYMAERKTKEIGVRKVMGASIFNITFLLTNNFGKLVLFANLIAWPIAYYFMSVWLQSFAYRIDMTLWPFLFSGIIAILIAVTTVSYQSVKAAIANPAKSLKYE